MSNPTPSQLKRLAKIIDELGFSVETDNTGQVVLYTGLMFGENGELVRWVDQDYDKPLGGQWVDDGSDSEEEPPYDKYDGVLPGDLGTDRP
jgi:hypothetical protein